MARPPCIEYEHVLYHITTIRNERMRLFLQKSDFEKFKQYMKDACQKYGFILHAYVFMM